MQKAENIIEADIVFCTVIGSDMYGDWANISEVKKSGESKIIKSIKW